MSFRHIPLLLLLFAALSAPAQTLRVLDRTTGQPVGSVALFTPSMNKSVITDSRGIASLDIFGRDDTVIFQHASYQRLTVTVEDLLRHEGKVWLVPRVVMLSESVVSVNRWEQNKEEVPNRIETIARETVTFYNPQTAADMLGASGQVFVQKSQLGGGSPMIRGFAANAVLLVVDGIRMNNAIYRSGNLQNVISLDPNTLATSEVIFGPGTVIYGSDALGGVMDFHTLVPFLSTSGTTNIKSHTLLRYASANNENTLHADITMGRKKWSSLTSLTLSRYDDLRMGSHRHPSYQRNEYVRSIQGHDSVVANPRPDVQTPSGYNQVNVLQKIRFRPGENTDYTLSFQYARSGDVPRYDRLIQYSHGHLKYAQWYYGPQIWMMPSLHISLGKKKKMWDKAKINIAYQYYEESRHDRKLNSTSLRHRTEQVYIPSLGADFEKQLPRNAGWLFYGLEASYNNVVSSALTEEITDGTTTLSPARYPAGYNHYLSTATYLTWKKNISGRLTFNGGLRYNYILLHSDVGDNMLFYPFPYDHISLHNDALNGSAGIAWHPAGGWEVKSNLSTGFRAPNLDDVGKIFDSEPGRVIVPNPGLKPEYLYSLDITVLKKTGKWLHLTAGAYVSWLDNAMVRRPFTFDGRDSILYDGEMSQVQALVNANSAFIGGLSATLALTLPKEMMLRSSLSWSHGKDNDGYAVRHVPPLFGETHLSWEKKGWKTDLWSRYNGAITYQNLAPSERGKSHMYETDDDGNPWSPPWWTLNITGSYTFPCELILQCAVENILDVRYRPYSSGIAAPGRNFILALRYNL